MPYKYCKSDDVLEISDHTIKSQLEREGRVTRACNFCESEIVWPQTKHNAFYMECTGCYACGPWVWDYTDPAGLNPTSWIYALKVCHDKWNGRAK